MTLRRFRRDELSLIANYPLPSTGLQQEYEIIDPWSDTEKFCLGEHPEYSEIMSLKMSED